jgi:hypothetical protein
MAYCHSAAELLIKALSVETSSPEEASELYARAIAVLLQGARGDCDLKRKQSVKAKILQYMTRLEKILRLCRGNADNVGTAEEPTPCQTEGSTVSG